MIRAGHFRIVKVIGFVFTCFFFSGSQAFAQTLLDDFNRPGGLIIGSAPNNLLWSEAETAGSNDYRARLENNMLVLSSRNNVATGSSGLEQVTFEAKTQYATTFNAAASGLTWAFNFRQSRIDPSGFGLTTYGLAYVLGSSKVNFKDPEAVGYAVIIGNSGSPDPIKLVRFKNGLTANTNLTTLITSAEISETAFYSIKVTFEPCSKTWSLQVRNDNGTFVDPLSVNNAALTFSDQTYTVLPLPFSGAAFNHGSVSETAYFDNIYLPDAPALANQTYTWNGLTSADFTEPTNWTPVRTCVRSSDRLEFGQGGTVSLANVTSQEIGQLAILNNTTLTLKAKTGATQALQIAGGQAEDLTIAAGSSLVIDSNDALEISLKTGSTAQISGSVIFQNTSMNLGRAHRLLAADANAIVFENGGQFFVNRLSGEPFGNAGTASVVRFKAGATYIAKDGASPFGLTSPNSKVIFETGSLYKHEQTGTAPKFDGRIYADFEMNVTGNVAINFGTSAITTTKIDNFLIRSGNLNITLASGTTPLPFYIKGNLTVANGAAFNFLPAAAVNTSLITFNGTSRQQISGNVNVGQFANLEINNPAGIELLTPLTIKGNLQFTNGKLSQLPGAFLQFEDNATASGMSNSSFAEGKVYKTGDDAFTFPVGKGNFYAPVAISNPLNVTDQYVAEYFLSDPSQLFGASAADSLVQISGSEYWDLSRTAGDSEVKVTLSYDVNRSGFSASQQQLRVAHFKSATAWVNEGRSVSASTSAYSLISTGSLQSSFSPFTFGIVAPNDPLPVELIAFTASRKANNVYLNWETASELNCNRFEIEKSLDGVHFSKIGEIKGQGTSSVLKRYAFTCKNSANGLEYYRLKQVDLDGTAAYSHIVSLKAESAGQVVVFPNPAIDFITISNSGANIGYVEVLNILGQVVKKVTVSTLQDLLILDIQDIPAGNYLLKINGEVKSFRFVKAAQ